MTRQDYIFHLDALRKGLLELIKFDQKKKSTDGDLSNPTELEIDRADKTQKMFENLAVRLYEDGAVSERIRTEKMMKGDFEQAEITFPKDKPNAEVPANAHGKKKGGKK